MPGMFLGFLSTVFVRKVPPHFLNFSSLCDSFHFLPRTFCIASSYKIPDPDHSRRGGRLSGLVASWRSSLCRSYSRAVSLDKFSPVVFSLVFLLYFFRSFPLVFHRSPSVPLCPLYVSTTINIRVTYKHLSQELHDNDTGGHSSRTMLEPERHKSTRTTRRNDIWTICDEKTRTTRTTLLLKSPTTSPNC